MNSPNVTPLKRSLHTRVATLLLMFGVLGLPHHVHSADELPAARVKKPPFGTVLDAQNKPVGNCRVWLRYECDKYYSDPRSHTVEETTTDSQGNYKFTKPLRFANLHGSLDGEIFTVFARKDGAGVAHESIAGVDPDGAALVLRMEPTHELGVHVQDEDMNPIAGAKVWIVIASRKGNAVAYLSRPIGWLEAVTDASGNAILHEIPDTAYAVSAMAAGFGTSDDNRWDRVKRAADGQADTTIPLLITLPKACHVGGVVLDDQGAPVPNLPVHIQRTDNYWRGHRRLLTDAAGRFRIDDLSAYGKNYPGSWRIWATGTEWTSAPITLQLSPGDRHEELRIEAVRGTLVKGIVRDVVTKDPIAGATLHVAQGPKPLANCRTYVWSDAAGNFSVRVPPGQANIYLEDVPVGLCCIEYGFGRSVVAQTTQPEEHVILETRTELHRMAKVRGKVIPPIAGVRVRAVLGSDDPNAKDLHLVGTTRHGHVSAFTPAGTTDRTGHFEAAEWPVNCPMIVFARSEDRSLAGWKCIETGGDGLTIEAPIVLQKTGSVQVNVTDAAGKAVAKTQLDVFLMKNGKWLSIEPEATTDKDGAAVVKGVLPGMTYKLRRSSRSDRDTELVLLDEITTGSELPVVNVVLP